MRAPDITPPHEAPPEPPGTMLDNELWLSVRLRDDGPMGELHLSGNDHMVSVWMTGAELHELATMAAQAAQIIARTAATGQPVYSGNVLPFRRQP